MNVTAVLARLEEDHAAEMENLRQCAELQGNFADAAEEASDSQSPVYDQYYLEGGNEAITSLTNFTDAEFHLLWSIVEGDVISAWTTGRGKKCKTYGKDAFLMALCVLKHYNTWDKHALDFGLRTRRW